MHIPDAYLSPVTEAAGFVAMAPLWFVAGRRTRRELTSKQAPLISIGAAFCFAIQMFNVPAAGGTTAHPLGAALLAVLVGPWAAVLGLTLTLLIQALLFGDGGVLAFGVNAWNMAVVAVFVSYGLYSLMAGSSETGSRRRIAAAGAGAYLGIVAAALSAGVLLGIQPSIAHDASGHALYCPFGLGIAVPAMVMSHLLVAGPAEAVVTVAALAYLSHSFPSYMRPRRRDPIGQGARLARTLGWVLVLTPVGLLAVGTGWGEWKVDRLARRVGYVPAGAARVHSLVRPLLPDYGFATVAGRPWQVVGYLVSGILGCTLVAVFTWGVLRRAPPPKSLEDQPPAAPTAEPPAWLLRPNASVAPPRRVNNSWFERTVLRARKTIERTVVAEEVARLPGLLQRLGPASKAAAALAMLLAVAVAAHLTTPGVVLAAAVLLAGLSRVPVGAFVARVLAVTAFFGLVVAFPLCLTSVSGSGAVVSFAGLQVSPAGLAMAELLLVRLAAGVAVAMLWHSTTRWYDLLATLRLARLPAHFVTAAALSYRYLFVLVETLSEMTEARTSRQVGAVCRRDARHFAGAGAAILFAKSFALTEELHWAMLARNGEGVCARSAAAVWRKGDAAVVAATLALAALAAWLRVKHAL